MTSERNSEEHDAVFYPEGYEEGGSDNRNWETKQELTSGQKVWFILGAMKAALVLAAVYGIVYFVVIWLMTVFLR